MLKRIVVMAIATTLLSIAAANATWQGVTTKITNVTTYANTNSIFVGTAAGIGIYVRVSDFSAEQLRFIEAMLLTALQGSLNVYVKYSDAESEKENAWGTSYSRFLYMNMYP